MELFYTRHDKVSQRKKLKKSLLVKMHKGMNIEYVVKAAIRYILDRLCYLKYGISSCQ